MTVILSRGRWVKTSEGQQGPNYHYPAQSIPSLLMTWHLVLPRHQAPWFWPSYPRIFQFFTSKGLSNQNTHGYFPRWYCLILSTSGNKATVYFYKESALLLPLFKYDTYMFFKENCIRLSAVDSAGQTPQPLSEIIPWVYIYKWIIPLLKAVCQLQAIWNRVEGSDDRVWYLSMAFNTLWLEQEKNS